MKNLTEYWKALTPWRRSFLVAGVIIASPVLVTLYVVIGLAEVWKMIQGVAF